ncbi:MAG TPA: hypothetical protein VN581_11950 [Patescibacteria group bacterium]|nr:hypothetical protein [Patescibacteria group bacterium]
MNSRTFVSLLLATVLTLPCVSSVAKEMNSRDEGDVALDLVAPYVQDELARRDIALALAKVRSTKDLSRLDAESRARLDKLSPKARARFLASLTFSDKGLSGFDYTVLVDELTATDIYRILELFGQQHITSMLSDVKVETSTDRLIMSMSKDPTMKIRADHMEYRCETRATCVDSTPHICTSNC